MFGKKKEPSVPAGQWFCPGCGLDEFYDLTQPTCPECGDSLHNKGYCPVCERHWALEPGALCPKHDLELETAPDAVEPPEEREYVPWVTAAVFPNSATAAILQGRLEAEGIPTYSTVNGWELPACTLLPLAACVCRCPLTKPPTLGSSCLRTGRCPTMRRPTSKTCYEDLASEDRR